MPDQTVTVNSAGGADFTSIQAAIDDSDVSDGFYKVEIQNNAAYAENLTLGGSTGTPTIANYLWLTATDAAYHGGVIETGARVSPTGSDHSIEITESFARVSKMLVEMSTGSGASNECIRNNNAPNTVVERTIMDARARNRTTNDGDCYYTQTDAATPQTLYNCLMIDANRAWVDMFDFDGILNIEFCTGYLCCETEIGTSEDAGYITPRTNTTGFPVVNAYNSVGSRNERAGVDQIWDASQDLQTTINASHNASSNNNPGTALTNDPYGSAGLVDSLVDADAYTDPTNFDLTIKDINSDLYLAGTDRSGSKPDIRVDATVDIRGETRPATPSIGAYEFVAAGGPTTIGVAAEIDTALAVAGSKSASVGISSEVDQALPMTPIRVAPAGIAVEADEALPIVGLKSQNSGVAVEADTALPLAGAKSLAAGLASEADIALPMTPIKALSIGIAPEIDTALPVEAPGITGIGIAAESDIALPMTAIKAVPIGIASEVDQAPGAGPTKAAQSGIAIELDTALPMLALKSAQIGIALEVDEALPIPPPGAVAVGIATGQDIALPMTALKAAPIGIATELDTTFSIQPAAEIAIGIAGGLDVALPVSPLKVVSIGIASEIDESFPISGSSKALGIGIALETDVALRFRSGNEFQGGEIDLNPSLAHLRIDTEFGPCYDIDPDDREAAKNGRRGVLSNKS